MLNFKFNMLTEVIFGKGEQKNVGKYIKKYGKKVLIHHSGSTKTNDLIKEIKNSIKNEELEFLELKGVRPNPHLSLVKEGISMCKKEGVDFVLAVGGGSAIDSSNAIAIGACYEGDVWDFYSGKVRPEKMLPIGSVLTIAGSGSECSRSSVITNESDSIKRFVNNEILRPKFSIMNPEITFTVSRYLTNCGCIDIMAHVIERYFTNERNVDLTDRLCEAILNTMLNNIPKVNCQPDNYDARAEIMWAGTLAHNGLVETGRTGDFASHMMGHQLSGLYDLTHGATLSIVLPAWMKYVYKHDIPRFAQFAHKVWSVDIDYMNMEYNALRGIEKMQEFFKSLNTPVTLKEAGVKKDDIPELTRRCVQVGVPIGHFVELNESDIRNIYELAYE